VDGCGEFQIYARIVLPLIRPALVVVGLYTFVFQYSSFVWPLVGTQSSSLQMISVGLANLNPLGGVHAIPYGYVAAGSVMATLVMTVVFLMFQRQFVGGSLLGALKE
jgi:ABC-type glycerol-3-phosphate transport system permease component